MIETQAPVLYPYQRRYLADSSRWKAACWSRQTGKTFTTTLEAVLDCLTAEAEGRIARWTILSISRDRAIDTIRTGAALHAQAIGAVNSPAALTCGRSPRGPRRRAACQIT